MPVRTRGQSRAIREGTGPQAGESEEDPNHYLGSLSMMGRAAFVSMMAEHEDIEAALRNDRPLRDPPYLSVYHASDLKTPTSYAEAMTSQQAPIWCDSMSREILGLLDADVFAVVQE